MTRIACLAAVMALAAGGATAAGRHEHSPASSASHHHHSSSAFVAPAVHRPPVVYPAFVGYVPSYSPYSSRQPLGFARAAGQALVYQPPISPDAPPFSFNGSEELPGWNWRRVSLQQIDAEVRAKRAAAPVAPPAFRKYCPDSRAYYADVTRCESDWLTVVGATARR